MSLGSRFKRLFATDRQTARTRLLVEQLEGREVPATLAPISDITTPNTKDLYIPLTVTNTTGTVNYTVTSGNTQVQAQLVTGGTTIRMHVTGTASDSTPFEGDLTFRLFDSLAPTTTARIVALVNQGFYDDVIFHRILNGFVAQSGDPTGTGSGGSGTTLDDEYNTHVTFNSPGLLAMANSGDDTGDSQFFITDTDLTLAQQPQHLNFQHTIFGQLVAGFDTFTKLITTPVQSPATGRPVSPVTITSASVVQNDPNGVLRITAPATFTGDSTITVTPSDGGASTGDSFKVTFVADTLNEPPFLGPIADQTTTVGTGVTFQLTGTDLENNPLTYSVISATNSTGGTVNVQSRIDQTTGLVTVTPPTGFTGVINLKLGVKDANATAPDTQTITLTVTGAFDLNLTSDTGTLPDDNVTSDSTPTLTILAPTGRTVSVLVNGASAGNATETSTPGQYTITLPDNLLRTGSNTITGTASGSTGTTSLAAFTLTYSPALRNVYIVPGARGSTQLLTVQLVSSEAAFKNELGYIKVDDVTGRIGTLRPSDAGYFAAAMDRRKVAFAPGATVGAASNMSAQGGDILALYIVQNSTSANLLSTNATNAVVEGKPIAFFSIGAANSDSTAHVSAADEPSSSQAIYGWEDLTGGGDRDFNDLVVNVRPAGSTASPTLVVPAAPGRAVTTTFQLQPATKFGSTAPSTTIPGEVGFIPVDDATGLIGALHPGDADYLTAALGRAKVLFTTGTAVSQTTSAVLTGGSSLIMYFVPGGTAAGVLASNPTNSVTGSKVAFFSMTSLNPDGDVHARFFNPEVVTGAIPTATDPIRVHMMGKVNGTANDFDDVVISVSFAT